MKLDKITNKAIVKNGINPNDEFYTPNYAILPLLKYIPSSSTVWCPFDTMESNFVKLFTKNGHTVIHSHIESDKDFFKMETPKDINYIISNPPYSIKYEVFKKLFALNIPFAMLVGVVGLFESQKRFELFKSNKFEIMYFNKRVSYFKNYSDQKPSLNPPFSSVYVTSNLLPDKIIFEIIKNK